MTTFQVVSVQLQGSSYKLKATLNMRHWFGDLISKLGIDYWLSFQQCKQK